MRDRLQDRLKELRAEYEKGTQAVEELESKLSNVRSMMMRISGAIQVLEEELGRPEDAEPLPARASEPRATNGSEPAHRALQG